MKNLKRFSGLVLALLIALNLAVVPAMAKNHYTVGTTSDSLKAAKEILFYEDFNSVTKDTVVVVNDTFGITNYTQLYVPTGEIDGDVKILGDGADNYLSLSKNTNNAKLKLRSESGTVFTGKYITEFKFMLPDDNAVNNAVIFCNTGGIGTTAKYYYGARIKYNANNQLQVYDGSTGSDIAIKKILQGVWYNVKVVTDIPNNKWTLYLNGNPLFRDESLHSISGTDNMLTPFEVTAINGTIYYDDIVMYREPVGRTTYSAEDFAGYGAGRDWATFENTAFVGANYMPTSYKADAVDAYDTWLQGLNLAPAKLLANGKIANGKMQLGGTGSQSIVLLNDYSENHNISEDMAVSFTFSTTDASKNHDEIYKMREHAGSTAGIRLQLNKRNLIADTNADGNGGNVILMSGIQDNREYRITVVSDFSAKTYSVYVDGVCVGTGLAHKEYTGIATYSDNGRPLDITLAATAPTCYYDDLVIYTDVREDVMTSAIGAAKTNAAAVKEGAATFALPASTATGYTVNWASDNAAITVENGTAAIAYPEQAQTVTLTATVADAANEYAIERKLLVNVPSKYEVNVTESEGVVTGTVTVNTDSAEGYSDGWAILAAYKGNQLVNVKTANVVNGKATVELDKITEKGSYKASLFLWKKDILKPIIANTTPMEFIIE